MLRAGDSGIEQALLEDPKILVLENELNGFVLFNDLCINFQS